MTTKANCEQQFHLTERELEVLLLVLDGNSVPQISRILEIETPTIDGHKKSIRNKLGCRTDYGIPAAITQEFGLNFFLETCFPKTYNSIDFIRLNVKEVSFVQYLIYDLKIVDLEKVAVNDTYLTNMSLKKIMKKSGCKSFFELVAILIVYNRIRIPIKLNLLASA